MWWIRTNEDEGLGLVSNVGGGHRNSMRFQAHRVLTVPSRDGCN